MKEPVIIDVDDLNEIIFEKYGRMDGEDTNDRITKQVEDYKYYKGLQHKDPQTGELVRAEDLPRPDGFDFDPTRVSTNYFRALVDRKARWQMGGDHTVRVPRKQIDEKVDTVSPDYEPSAEQQKELERAEKLEELIRTLWNENRMKERLLTASRDRLLGGRVVCKIAWNPHKGRLQWIFRPDYEYVPIYSDDDFEELEVASFLIPKTVIEEDEPKEAVQIQTFSLEGEDGSEKTCYLEEVLYLVEDMKPLKTIIPKTPMELNFIPVVEFPIEVLSANDADNMEVEGIRRLNDILNQMNEDAIDSIKFEMFPLTAFIDVPEGTVNSVTISPGAYFEVQGQQEGLRPTIEKIESSFKWKEAMKDQYNRVKSSMHEITGLPQVVPSEMNIGGLNDEALRILFQDIIADTEEHWLSWEYGLKELHEKSLKYLQARKSEPNFAYDKEFLSTITEPEHYETEMVFMLPLPDNRKDKVNLLIQEITNDLESKAGAMERLGVPDIQAKMAEIENEKMREKMLDDPYAGADGDLQGTQKATEGGGQERINENGEVEEICPTCGGSGRDISDVTGEEITCRTCSGTGWHQPRKR